MSNSKRILVIDDEPTALDLLRRILEMKGYDVLVATNGLEGVKLFLQQPCDLVITDMVMPVKDGLQTILDLRSHAPDLPVIAISGGGTISKERYLAVAGYLDRVITIAKPFAIEDITEAVSNLLQDQSSESSEEI
ncbi:MAG: response regulator [Desulfobulbaceae bacterium]|nr:response regulator [Desulfobulbaceae bacterium]